MKAVGITNQRETCLFWDKATGEPIHRALVWQDRRTADLCADLKSRGLEEMVRAKTGLVFDPYFLEQRRHGCYWIMSRGQENALKGETCCLEPLILGSRGNYVEHMSQIRRMRLERCSTTFTQMIGIQSCFNY